MVQILDDAWNLTDALDSFLEDLEDVGTCPTVQVVAIISATLPEANGLLRGLKIDIKEENEEASHGVDIVKDPYSNCVFILMKHAPDLDKAGCLPSTLRRALTFCVAAANVIIVPLETKCIADSGGNRPHESVAERLGILLSIFGVVKTLEKAVRPAKLIVTSEHWQVTQTDFRHDDIPRLWEDLFHAGTSQAPTIIPLQTAPRGAFGRLRQELTAGVDTWWINAAWGHYVKDVWRCLQNSLSVELNMFKTAHETWIRRTQQSILSWLETELAGLENDTLQQGLPFKRALNLFDAKLGMMPKYMDTRREKLRQDFIVSLEEVARKTLRAMQKTAAKTILESSKAALEAGRDSWTSLDSLPRLRDHLQECGRRCLSLYKDALQRLQVLRQFEPHADNIFRLTPTEVDKCCIEFTRTLDDLIKAETETHLDMLEQKITREIKFISEEFNRLCVFGNASDLEEKLWTLCVQETRRLWKRYGIAFGNLLYPPNLLVDCLWTLTERLTNSAGAVCDVPRHPWDALLVLVSRSLISQLDLSSTGMAHCLMLKNEDSRQKGLDKDAALQEAGRLLESLKGLDFIKSRPHSLDMRELPQVQLTDAEARALQALTPSVADFNSAWKSFRESQDPMEAAEPILPLNKIQQLDLKATSLDEARDETRPASTSSHDEEPVIQPTTKAKWNWSPEVQYRLKPNHIK